MGVLSGGFIELPAWLTWDLVFHILDSKIFSAIYWGAAAVVAVIGFIARMKYRDRNLKRLLDAYVEKAKKADDRERQSVKVVIRSAIEKARGQATRGTPAAQFRPSDVFENAARFFAQSQAPVAIELLKREALLCEATINYSEHQVRHARMRAATAYLEIGSMLREQNGREVDALNAFRDMLRVNPGDEDALRMLGVQCRHLNRYPEAEQYFTTLLYQLKQETMVADIKRELALVFVAANDSRAEGVLQEALAIETNERNQHGEALTHELIGLARSRYRWGQARRAYRMSKAIFETLRDTESVKRVQRRIDAMEAHRREELARRREKRRIARTRVSTSEEAQITIIH